MQTNKTTVTEANRPRFQEASRAMRPPLLWRGGEKKSHTSAWLAWRNQHTVKVHVQGHNDKSRRLVHRAQRTMLGTTSAFADPLPVSSAENVHLTKHSRKLNVTLSLFILCRNTEVTGQRNVPATGDRMGCDEGGMIFVTLSA